MNASGTMDTSEPFSLAITRIMSTSGAVNDTSETKTLRLKQR